MRHNAWPPLVCVWGGGFGLEICLLSAQSRRKLIQADSSLEEVSFLRLMGWYCKAGATLIKHDHYYLFLGGVSRFRDGSFGRRRGCGG